MKKWMLLVLIAAVGPAFGDDPVLATIGREKLTASQVDEQLRLMGIATGYPSILAMPAEQQQRWVDRIVGERVFYRAAMDERIRLDSENEKRLQIINRQAYAWQYVADRMRKSTVTEAQLRAFHKEHKAEFDVPESRKPSHIVVRTREEAESALARLKAGGKLEEVAGEVNIDQSRTAGGALPWMRRNMAVAPSREFLDALFSLQKGETGGIVRTPAGFEIIRLDDIRPAVEQPFEQVRFMVQRRYEEDAVDRLDRQLRVKYGAVVTLPAAAPSPKETPRGAPR